MQKQLITHIVATQDTIKPRLWCWISGSLYIEHTGDIQDPNSDVVLLLSGRISIIPPNGNIQKIFRSEVYIKFVDMMSLIDQFSQYKLANGDIVIRQIKNALAEL